MKKINYNQRQFLQSRKNNVIINELIAKIASAFFIAITAFYPIFIDFEGYSGMTYKKALFFWIVTGIATVLIFFMFICIKERFSMDNYHTENEPLRRGAIAELALLAFIIWTLISAVISVFLNPAWANHGFGSANVWFGANNRYEGFITFLCYVLTFIIIARFYKIKDLHLQLFAVSTILVALIGILQFFGFDIFRLSPYNHSHFRGPLTIDYRTTLGNLNLVSSYCSFAIILFTALFTVSRSKWQYLYLGAGVCSFALSLTTGFSGDSHTIAILGSMILLIPYLLSNRERLGRILIVISNWCIVYAGYSAYISVLKKQSESGKLFHALDQEFINAHTNTNTALLLIIGIVLLIVGLGLILLLKKWSEKIMKIAALIFLPVVFISGLIGIEIVGSRLSEKPDNIIWQAREMMHGRLDDDFGSYRGWIWRNAVEIIPDNPVFGTGPDTFFHAIGSERQAESAERYGLNHDKAHNIFLQIAVCMGIPALIAYLIFLGSLFISAAKQAFERPILFAFGAAALSYVIQSFFSIEGPTVMPLFWISLGVIASELWIAKIGHKSMKL